MYAVTYLLVLAYIGSASAANQPRFRFNSYDGPDGNVAQFYFGNDNEKVYNWGYNYPGQSHFESRSEDGKVKGTYTFIDPVGKIQQTSYNADPESGYTAEQQILPAGSQQFDYEEVINLKSALPESFPGVPDQVGGVPAVYSISGVPNTADVQTNAGGKVPPAIVEAVRDGRLDPIDASANEIIFRVSESLVQEAGGSISAIASLLDVDTFSPRHDAQIVRGPNPVPYSAVSRGTDETDVRGVLEVADTSSGDRFIVRIPQ